MFRSFINNKIYGLIVLCISIIVVHSAESSAYHTIMIDGVNDFVSDETLTSSSDGYNWFVTWDASNFYFGVQGIDIGAGSPNKFLVLYISGSPGTRNGQQYNTQVPQLPFPARYHFRYKLDGSFMSLEIFNGTAWVDQGSSGITWEKSGNYVEFAIPRSALGNLNFMKICGGLLNETTGGEWTYAMIPHQTAQDSYNPQFSKWLGYPLFLTGVIPTSPRYLDASPVGIRSAFILLMD
jgi:hypothetical protein